MTPLALLHGGYATVAVPPFQAKLTVPQCHGVRVPTQANLDAIGGKTAILPARNCPRRSVRVLSDNGVRSCRSPECPSMPRFGNRPVSAHRGQAPTRATHRCERGERSKPGSLRRIRRGPNLVNHQPDSYQA